MVSPEDLSVEHSRELARNRTDMRFMEDDEEKAYSWIRFWCEDECKAVKDLKYQKVKLRHRAEAKKAKAAAANAAKKARRQQRAAEADPTGAA